MDDVQGSSAGAIKIVRTVVEVDVAMDRWIRQKKSGEAEIMDGLEKTSAAASISQAGSSAG